MPIREPSNHRPLRRRSLRARAACVALLAVAAAAHAGDGWRQTHERVDIADGVGVFVAAESPGGVVQGNISVISGTRATLVVDSGQYPRLAAEVVDWIHAAGLPPVRWLVNTHWHGDHLLANHVFVDAWPQLVVIQHPETARIGAVQYADFAQQAPQRVHDAIAQLQATLDSGQAADGSALDDDERARLQGNLAVVSHWAEHGRGARWDAPELTVADALTLDLGERRVTVRHLGRANTGGDLVVWDPATRTLVTGDIVVAPTPYSFGSFHGDWIHTLDALRALDPAWIVPGHGAPMQDDAYLRRLQALLADTRAAVRAEIEAGADLDQVRARVTLPAHERAFAGDDPARIRAFRRFYLAPGIERAWREARGEPLDEI